MPILSLRRPRSWPAVSASRRVRVAVVVCVSLAATPWLTAASTTEPTPSTPTTDAAGSTTAPPTGVPPNPDSNPGSNPPPVSGETQPTVVEDPLAGEGPGESPPDVDVTVPPKDDDTYDQPPAPYEPPPILWSSLAAAEEKVEETRDEQLRTFARVRSLRLRLKHLDWKRIELDEARDVTTGELLEATDRFRERAIAGFQRFGSGGGSSGTGIGLPGAVGTATEVDRHGHLIDKALQVDESQRLKLDKLQGRLGRDQLESLEQRKLLERFLDNALVDATEADAAHAQALIEYEAFKAGSEVYISGVVFPIDGPYSTPIIDSFGFPRMTGTPDEHWHEGIDLFAPRGTPLVAAERGVIAKLGTGRLGGRKFWLIGESGSEWYYAHLDAFAPGLQNGLVVEAGDLLGFVGDSGNAVGTPPHLHLQLHPDGGRPVNPYPLLKVVSDIDFDRGERAQGSDQEIVGSSP